MTPYRRDFDAEKYRWGITSLLFILGMSIGMLIQSERMRDTIVANKVHIEYNTGKIAAIAVTQRDLLTEIRKIQWIATSVEAKEIGR